MKERQLLTLDENQIVQNAIEWSHKIAADYQHS
jgi:hypothetical protein